MSDYIKRKSIRDMYSCLDPNARVLVGQVLTDIDAIPTIDAVSVVRCKECKHTNSEPPIADGRSWCVLHGCFMYYCSDGEREGE